MMHKCLLLLSLIFLLISQESIQAQAKYSNEFLTIGVGARAHGMSGAVVASLDDLGSAFWNPAGLASIQAPSQFSAMHAEWFAGIAQYDYVSFGKSMNREKESFGALTLIRMGIDQIPYTLQLIGPDGSVNYDNISEFSAADYAGYISYAQRMGDKPLYIGGNVKIVHRSIGRFAKSWGFGIDAGLRYKKDRFRAALMAKDITTTFNAWSFNLTEEEKEVFQETDNVIPVSTLEQTLPRFILGASYDFKLGEKSSLLGEVNLDFTTDGQRNVLISSKSINIDPHIGAEFDYNNRVYLRAGVGNIQEVLDDLNPGQTNLTLQPNLGVGLGLGRLRLDYAFTNIGNVSESLTYSHIFSLLLDFKERE